MKNLFVALILTLFLTLPCYAAPLTDWGAVDVVTFGDPGAGEICVENGGDLIEDGANIVQVYYRFTGGVHYFRMDLLDVPAAGRPPSFAPEYAVALDLTAGGLTRGNPSGNDTHSGYIPATLTGIDTILVAHYSNGAFGGMAHRHNDVGTEPSNVDLTMLGSLSGGAFQNSENGGATLEWSIGDSALIGSPGALDPSTFWFATFDIDGINEGTYDLAQAVPEPSSILLLGSGLLSLLGFSLRRLRNRIWAS